MGASDVKWNFRLTFDIDLPDSKLDTIMTSLMAAFTGIAAQVVHQVTVGFAEKSMASITCPQCHCQGGHHWKTRHGEPTIFETLLGKLSISQLQLQCPNGHKFFITRQILGIEKRKHMSSKTEKKLGLLGALTSFRVSAKITSLFGITLDKMRMWRAVQKVAKSISFELDPTQKPEVEADGTGIPTVGVQKRGRELKVAVQRKKGGGIRIAGLGIGPYDGGWEAIFSPMIPVIRTFKKFLLVTDGDTNIFKALGDKVTVVLQRCLFHIPHQLKHTLWMDGVKRNTPAWSSAMSRIHSICSARYLDTDEETVKKAVEDRLKQLDYLIARCETDGFKHSAAYLKNAKPDLFTGVLNRFSGQTTSLVERVMRTVNMRINVGKWSMPGALNVNKIRLAYYYNGFDA
jgi:hypothetical protein